MLKTYFRTLHDFVLFLVVEVAERVQGGVDGLHIGIIAQIDHCV